MQWDPLSSLLEHELEIVHRDALFGIEVLKHQLLNFQLSLLVGGQGRLVLPDVGPEPEDSKDVVAALAFADGAADATILYFVQVLTGVGREPDASVVEPSLTVVATDHLSILWLATDTEQVNLIIVSWHVEMLDGPDLEDALSENLPQGSGVVEGGQ